jgi:delta-1-pyrroline-5-carboxylate synthetase
MLHASQATKELSTMAPSNASEPASRALLRTANRVVVKAGTSIVTNSSGQLSITRLGAIVEQISELVKNGTEVIFVSSGAVGMGKNLLRKQAQMSLSLNDLAKTHSNGNLSQSFGQTMDTHIEDSPLHGSLRRTSELNEGMKTSKSFLSLVNATVKKDERKKHYDSACAAAGQLQMMTFYSSLFDQCDIAASQILVTQADFMDEQRLKNLTYSIDRLLSLGIVPIVNENDAVSGNLGYTTEDVFSDNDSLAALCARNFNAEALLMLTDVCGVFDRPPSEKGAKLLKFYEGEDVAIGEKSTQGE